MSVCIGDVFYDNLNNKVIVNGVFQDGTISATIYHVITIKFDNHSSTEIKEEESIYQITDIGKRLFYHPNDYLLHEKILYKTEYAWLHNDLSKFFLEQEEREIAKIRKFEPSKTIITFNDKIKIIKNYFNKAMQDREEELINKKDHYCFGRMDFDTEFFLKQKENLWKEHYYNKIYIGKANETIKCIDEQTEIISWKNPVAGHFYANADKFFTISTYGYVYNYEMLMKRRFDGQFDGKKYKTVYIADVDSDLYNDGDMDPFLIDVLSRLRKSGNEKASDIISTIQKDQNTIIREKLDTNFYVQGCAGSGKTMILLHRLSCLLYNNKNLNIEKIKIITPNENIINQLKDLSAELMINCINQMTLEKYYMYLISQYSMPVYKAYFDKDGRALNTANENLLPSIFLEYIYSNECLDSINTYFNSDNLFIIRQLVDRFNLKINSLQDYLDKIRKIENSVKSSLIEKENQITKKDLLETRLRELKDKYDKEINLNVKINNMKEEIQSIEIKKETLISYMSDILSLQQYEERLFALREERRLFETFSFLNDINEVDGSHITKEIIFNSVAEMSSVFEEMERKEKNDTATLIEIEANLFQKINVRINTVNNLHELEKQIKETTFINFFRRSKLFKKINDQKNELSNTESVIINLEKDLTKAKSIVTSDLNEKANIINNAKKYLIKFIDAATSLEKSLMLNIDKLHTKINDELVNYNVTIDNVSNEIDNLKKIRSDKDNELREMTNKIFKDILIEMEEISKQLLSINKKISDLSYTIDDLALINMQYDKLLNKNKDGYSSTFDSQTVIRIIASVLKPLLNKTYTNYNIERTSLPYKHNLYLILVVMEKIYGEKTFNTLLCIDEAQDITVNEYDVIKKANKNSILNLYGDTNQLLYPKRGISNWEQLDNLNLKSYNLNINYRNVNPITRYCNEKIPQLNMMAMGVEGLPVKEILISDIINSLDRNTCIIVKNKSIIELLPIDKMSINIIEKKDNLIDNKKLNIYTVEMVKGMEFSSVIVVDINMTIREKYVAYTRALNMLIVAH